MGGCGCCRGEAIEQIGVNRQAAGPEHSTLPTSTPNAVPGPGLPEQARKLSAVCFRANEKTSPEEIGRLAGVFLLLARTLRRLRGASCCTELSPTEGSVDRAQVGPFLRAHCPMSAGWPTV